MPAELQTTQQYVKYSKGYRHVKAGRHQHTNESPTKPLKEKYGQNQYAVPSINSTRAQGAQRCNRRLKSTQVCSPEAPGIRRGIAGGLPTLPTVSSIERVESKMCPSNRRPEPSIIHNILMVCRGGYASQDTQDVGTIQG